MFFPQDDLKLVHVGFADITPTAGPFPHLECFPIRWNHVIETEALRFKELEHVPGGRACLAA